MTGQSFHLLPDTSKPVCYQYNQTTVLSTVCATLCCLVPLVSSSSAYPGLGRGCSNIPESRKLI